MTRRKPEQIVKLLRKADGRPFKTLNLLDEFTAEAVQTWLAKKSVGPAFIPPGQPWKNGFIESFHDKFRDECLQIVIEDWRLHYNTRRDPIVR